MTAARSYRAPLCPFEVIAEFEKDGLQKYKPKYILTFLENIANAYQNNRVMLSDGTVSYTHLDVYKRQFQWSPLSDAETVCFQYFPIILLKFPPA